MKYPTIDIHGVISEMNIPHHQDLINLGNHSVYGFRRIAFKTQPYHHVGNPPGRMAYLEVFVADEWMAGEKFRREKVLEFINTHAAWLWTYAIRVTTDRKARESFLRG